MKKITKQLIAILLAMFLLTTSVPASVYAASPDTGSEESAAAAAVEEESGESQEEAVQAAKPAENAVEVEKPAEDAAETAKPAEVKSAPAEDIPADASESGNKAASGPDEQQKQKPEEDAPAAATASYESAEKTEVTVSAVKKGNSYVFEAELSEVRVKAVVGSQYANKNAVMKAQVFDASAFQAAVLQGKYGKLIDSVSGVKLSFLNKNGKTLNVKADITLTSKKTGSAQYVLYQTSGKNSVKELASAKSAAVTVKKTAAVSFALAGLSDDGIARIQGVTKKGTTTFTLNKEGVQVTVKPPAASFPAKTWMELKAADTARMEEAARKLLGTGKNAAVQGTVTFSFHTPAGKEIKPGKELTVTISLPMDKAADYALVRIEKDGAAALINKAAFNGTGVKFTTKVPASYGIVEVSEDKPYETEFGDSTFTVNAPEGAFATGTQIQVSGESDVNVIKNALTVLDQNKSYSFKAMDISFDLNGREVEPAEGKEVEVIWEDDFITSGSKIIHIKDDGSAELIRNAVCTKGKAVFTAKSFSTYVTARLNTFKIGDKVVFTPQSLNDKVADELGGEDYVMTSGLLEDTHPEFEGYTYVNATYVKKGSESEDPVIYLGSFDYIEYDDNGNEIGRTNKIYFRTEKSINDSDLIVTLANEETIHLNYEATPYNVTYVVRYNGTNYTIGQDALPADLSGLVVTGPSSVAEGKVYEGDKGVKVSLPRGYSATVRMSHENQNQSPSLGAGSEPTYSCTDGWTVTPDTNTFTIDGVYTIRNVTSDITVNVNLSKRSSYAFSARPAFSTAYFGGRQGDVVRYSTDSNNPLTNTFTGNTFTFTFTTRAVTSNRYQWVLDSFNINKETINVPYVNATTSTAQAVTELKSGTVVTLSARFNQASSPTRTYTVTVTNCYENITITGGNLHGLGDHLEWVVQETKNLAEFDYLADDWLPLKPGEPMTYAMQGTSYKTKVIRFKVKAGYVNPQVKYITQNNQDQYTRVGDITLSSSANELYHLVASQPESDGYFYFHLNGTISDPGLLSVRAELARYGVSYSAGSVSGSESFDPVVPDYDYGGYYGDGTLKGYNIEDNEFVILADSAPVDQDNHYIFMYYTVDGGDQTKHYAPSQKIPLADLAPYAAYDPNRGEYVIPVTAHWEKKTAVTPINMTADIYLDDVKADTVVTVVPQHSSIYVDIDSKTMINFMEGYNWQLFFDEMDSEPFIDDITEENSHVNLYLYSKFYVYHSATGTLKLHTTKEMETISGNTRSIGTLDITNLVTDGYYYGGYYIDYLGAYSGSTNLIKKAADDNNENGTLTASEIDALSKGDSVVIAQNIAADYRPDQNADQINNWKRASAFTTALKTADSSWCGNRGPDTETLTTGGTGTAVKIARAGIYCLHEVPGPYLSTPKAALIRDNYGSGPVVRMQLLSATDISIFRAGGIKINGTDKKGAFAKTFSLVKYDPATGYETPETKDATFFNVAGGYLTVTDGNSCVADGSYVLEPYWITYDNVKVYGGAAHTRTLTVSGNGNNVE